MRSIEGQTTLAPTLCMHMFHMVEDQNINDRNKGKIRSKHAFKIKLRSMHSTHS